MPKFFLHADLEKILSQIFKPYFGYPSIAGDNVGDNV